MSTNNNDKATKFNPIYGLAIIGILFFAIILTASIMGVFKGYEPYQQLIAAMLSVAATGVITALLLYFQRRQQEQLNQEQREFEEKQKDKDKERLLDTKIFEERLRIYKEFLKKLCDVVKDQNITPEEEIELQFQVSYIAMHTSSKTISSISEQVSDIVVNLKQGSPDANNMLMQLFSIADCFYEELYKEKNEFDPDDRDNTIENFRAILVPHTMVADYEKDQKDRIIQSLKDEENRSGKLDIKDRSKLLRAMISKNGAMQTANGAILVYKYFTARVDGAYTDSKDSILIFLLPDEKDERYKILVFTRQREEAITKEIIKGIWPNEEFHPWDSDKSRHIHETISFKENNEEIKNKIEKVLQEVKEYRNKKYPLK